jgi:hypothetical protein
MKVFWMKGRKLLYTLRSDSDGSGNSTDSGDEPDNFNGVAPFGIHIDVNSDKE